MGSLDFSFNFHRIHFENSLLLYVMFYTLSLFRLNCNIIQATIIIFNYLYLLVILYERCQLPTISRCNDVVVIAMYGSIPSPTVGICG